MTTALRTVCTSEVTRVRGAARRVRSTNSVCSSRICSLRMIWSPGLSAPVSATDADRKYRTLCRPDIRLSAGSTCARATVAVRGASQRKLSTDAGTVRTLVRAALRSAAKLGGATDDAAKTVRTLAATQSVGFLLFIGESSLLTFLFRLEEGAVQDRFPSLRPYPNNVTQRKVLEWRSDICVTVGGRNLLFEATKPLRLMAGIGRAMRIPAQPRSRLEPRRLQALVRTDRRFANAPTHQRSRRHVERVHGRASCLTKHA